MHAKSWPGYIWLGSVDLLQLSSVTMRRRMATLLLIRHGQASYGDVDYDRLSSRGEAQAREVGKLLAGMAIDRLFVGPHKRQVDTAALARETAAALPAATQLAELAEYPGFELVRHSQEAFPTIL